ncbi:hypothetical protein V9L05_07315 [Bernardetia sp. Wsw4-3y2]|uniref:hypothetical protein n=1 Tax=Bernardetia sp. Wsw4-3y2 TaxID=3127471 RepID=UPI0030CA93C7
MFSNGRNIEFETIVKAKPRELEKYVVKLKEEKYPSKIEKLKDWYGSISLKSLSQYGTTNQPYSAPTFHIYLLYC